MAQTIGWLRITDATEAVEAAAVVRGTHCREARELFTEWSRALGFGRHFGGNWDAFADSLTEAVLLDPDNSVRPPTTILVEEAGQLLAEEPDRQWATFLDALRDVSTVRDDDEDAACFPEGSPRLVLILRDTPEHLNPVANRLAALGYIHPRMP